LQEPPSPSLLGASPSLSRASSPASTLAPRRHKLCTWAWEWDGWGDAGDVLGGVNGTGPALHAPRDKRLPDVPVGDDESVFDGGSYIGFNGYDNNDGEGGAGSEGDAGGVAQLSREDAAHVVAWRRRCVGLECVRMVSGGWWMRDGE
jgi:hypothetical protein